MNEGHSLYTAEQLARSALGALKYKSTLARLVNTDYSKEFIPGRGASVTVKRPVMIDKARVYSASDRQGEAQIQYSDLYEPYTSIKVTDQIYNAVRLPDDFSTFTLSSMEHQVVAPMAESVAEAINNAVVAAFSSVGAGLTAVDKAKQGEYVGTNGTVASSYSAVTSDEEEFAGFGVGTSLKDKDLTAADNSEVLKVIRAAHRLFGERGVPLGNRYLVVGAGWEAALLSQNVLNKVNESGSTGQLRQAEIGTIYGFRVITDYSIDALKAYAFERDAITLVTRTTVPPKGAAFASVASAEGFALRYLHDYDMDYLRDRAVIDTFAGAKVLDPQRIVALTGKAGFEEPVAPKPVTTPAG